LHSYQVECKANPANQTGEVKEEKTREQNNKKHKGKQFKNVTVKEKQPDE